MLSINLKSNVIWLWHSQYALGALRALRAPRGFGRGSLMKANNQLLYHHSD